MRQADLRIGREYALTIHDSLDPLAARVRLVSVDGGGSVTVQVLDAGPRPVYAADARPVRRNGKLQVSTRSIACPWEQWAERVREWKAKQEAQAASYQSVYEDLERRRAERVGVDSSRPLPEAYDEDRFKSAFDPDEDAAERETLVAAYSKHRRLGPYVTEREIGALLIDLPVPVLRDILAADKYGRPGAAGTVAAVFARAAELLEMARIGMQQRSGHSTRQPGEIITQTDVAFVRAAQARVASGGGRLLLPSVPPLPDWVEHEVRETATGFGWLRLAVADSKGEKLHAAGCSLLHHRMPVLNCPHRPWWSVLLADETSLCTQCGGPGLRDLVAFAGFAAAADVWKARGCDRIEDWQQQALQRLIAATAAARAQSSEPDLTLAHRAVSALAANPPGQEGWDAYGLCTAAASRRPTRTAQNLPPAKRDAAADLLRERIGVLESVLPEPKPYPQLPRIPASKSCACSTRSSRNSSATASRSSTGSCSPCRTHSKAGKEKTRRSRRAGGSGLPAARASTLPLRSAIIRTYEPMRVQWRCNGHVRTREYDLHRPASGHGHPALPEVGQCRARPAHRGRRFGLPCRLPDGG